MNFSDFTDLVEETIGIEAVEWLFEFLSDTYGEESEIDAVIEECEKDLQAQKKKSRTRWRRSAEGREARRADPAEGP